MNAESEMRQGDGLGADPEEQGTIYAVPVVLEALNATEAFDRVSDEVGPEPANAHFVGEPIQIERADEYDTASVAEQLATAAKGSRCLFCNDPDGGATHCPHCGAYNRSEPLSIRTRADIRADLAKLGSEYDEDEITAQQYDEGKLGLLEEALDAPDWLGGDPQRVPYGQQPMSDATAMDALAAKLNEPGQWNGGDVCEVAATLCVRTGRPIEDEPEDED